MQIKTLTQNNFSKIIQQKTLKKFLRVFLLNIFFLICPLSCLSFTTSIFCILFSGIVTISFSTFLFCSFELSIIVLIVSVQSLILISFIYSALNKLPNNILVAVKFLTFSPISFFMYSIVSSFVGPFITTVVSAFVGVSVFLATGFLVCAFVTPKLRIIAKRVSRFFICFLFLITALWLIYIQYFWFL